MVALHEVIKTLYPDAESLADYLVANDGNGAVIIHWNPALGTQPTEQELAAAEAATELRLIKQRITATRYEKEIAGISIEGQAISSERDEIGHWYPRFANAYGWLNADPFSLAANPTGEYPYKPKQGNPTVFNATQVVRAYQCLSWYVNTCFATEATLFGMLGTGTTVAEMNAILDADAVWPQREFTWIPPS